MGVILPRAGLTAVSGIGGREGGSGEVRGLFSVVVTGALSTVRDPSLTGV